MRIVISDRAIGDLTERNAEILAEVIGANIPDVVEVHFDVNLWLGWLNFVPVIRTLNGQRLSASFGIGLRESIVPTKEVIMARVIDMIYDAMEHLGLSTLRGIQKAERLNDLDDFPKDWGKFDTVSNDPTWGIVKCLS